MVREFLSNLFIDTALFVAVGILVFTFVIGPRFKGRRAMLWAIRRAVKEVPGAVVTETGHWPRRRISVRWPTSLSYGRTAKDATLELALSQFSPWEVALYMTSPGLDRGLIAIFRWNQWPPNRDDVECSSRRDMHEAISRYVRFHLNFKVRREFQRPLDLARASHRGFQGLDLNDVFASL